VAVAADAPAARAPNGFDPASAAAHYRHVSDSLTVAPITEGASPYLPDGRTVSGATGVPIPCTCVYGGTTYKLGQTVCMSTHMGTVMTRCELFLNNTSWKPTDEPCKISRAPSGGMLDVAAAAAR
jgi:hypothetical protein